MKMYGLRFEPWDGAVKIIEIEATETKGQYQLEESPMFIRRINKSAMSCDSWSDGNGYDFIGLSVESVVNRFIDYYNHDINQCRLRIEKDEDLIQKAKEVAAHV